MERFNFGTYRVDDENHSAYTHCHAIANLTSPAPQPVLLLGEPGCGKTHLLYSVVNRVRSQFADVGIAYINAEEIPNEIRNLIRDPMPLKNTKESILLVDELDSFSGQGEELEEIIRLFMNEEHFVIVASNVHPKRLKHLPNTLTSLLLNGTICPIHPEPSNAQENFARQTHKNDLDRLTRDKSDLQAQSINAGIVSNMERLNSNADDSLLLALKAELEDLQSQLANAHKQLNVARTALEKSKGPEKELIEVEGDDFQELKLQIENLKGENALLSFAEKESRGLREQLKRAKEELETIQHADNPAPVVDPIETNALHKDAEERIRVAEEMKAKLDEERTQLIEEKDDLSKQIVRLQALKETIDNANRAQSKTTTVSEPSEQSGNEQQLRNVLNLPLDSISQTNSFDDILGAIQDLKDERLDLMQKLTQNVDELALANTRIETVTEDLDQQKLLMTDMELAVEVLRNEGFQGQLDLKGQIKELEASLKSAEEREAQSHLRDEALSIQLNQALESISKERGIPMHELSNDPKIIQLKSFSEDAPSSPDPFTVEPKNENDEETPSETENSVQGVHLDAPKTDASSSDRIVSLETRTMYHIEELEEDNIKRTDENQTA
jgi:hypothetical protein